MRRARLEDIPILIALMTEFYAESGYPLDGERAGAAFADLLRDERLGSVWLIQSRGEDVGHLVLTRKYAMEYGGFVACLDDLYVRPAWRNQGLSTSALAEVTELCRRDDVRALTVEVGGGNGPARTVYLKAGFTEVTGRELLVLALAPAAHEHVSQIEEEGLH